jgi:hypothetical protein
MPSGKGNGVRHEVGLVQSQVLLTASRQLCSICSCLANQVEIKRKYLCIALHCCSQLWFLFVKEDCFQVVVQSSQHFRRPDRKVDVNLMSNFEIKYVINLCPRLKLFWAH